MSFITNAIGSVVGSLTGANQQAKASQSAASDQYAAAMAGIQQQQNEFNSVQQLLSPFVSAGTSSIGNYQGALGQLGNLTGANGAAAQGQAISGLTSNPLYTAAMQLGQQSILQNASATGGLRGGNTISSLGYLPQQTLASVMQQQIGNLGTYLGSSGNLLSLGENAAAGVGNAGMSTGNNITSLLGQAGAAQGASSIASGNATASGLNSLGSLLGNTSALSNIGSLFSSIGSGIGSLWSSAAGLMGGD